MFPTGHQCLFRVRVMQASQVMVKGILRLSLIATILLAVWGFVLGWW